MKKTETKLITYSCTVNVSDGLAEFTPLFHNQLYDMGDQNRLNIRCDMMSIIGSYIYNLKGYENAYFQVLVSRSDDETESDYYIHCSEGDRDSIINTIDEEIDFLSYLRLSNNPVIHIDNIKPERNRKSKQNKIVGFAYANRKA